jgi:hypothetical protein
LGAFFYDVMGRMKIAKMWFLHPEHAHTELKNTQCLVRITTQTPTD